MSAYYGVEGVKPLSLPMPGKLCLRGTTPNIVLPREVSPRRSLTRAILYSTAKRRGSRRARVRVQTGATVVRFSRLNAVAHALKRVETLPSSVRTGKTVATLTPSQNPHDANLHPVCRQIMPST